MTQLAFTIDEEFKTFVKEAITRAPKRKVAGSDGLFSEASCCALDQIARLLTAKWKKCAYIQGTSDQLETATLIPIYKTGNKGNPTSY